jgi:6-phosphogluconolactonase
MATVAAPASAVDVYFGTGGPSAGRPEGIYVSSFDEATGNLGASELVIELPGAGWVTQHPTLPVLYASARVDGVPSVVAVSLNDSGAALINAEAIGSGGACFVTTDQTGTLLMSAQYGGGSVAVFPIAKDGSIGTRTQLIQHGQPSRVHKNQQAAHPHCVAISPDNRFAMVCDLGMDKIVVYELDLPSGKLKEVAQADAIPGGGPRHMKFHPDGKYALVLNELALSISVYQYDGANGTMTLVETTESLTAQEKAINTFNSGSEIRIHPSGKFVYSANRGHDSISVYRFDAGEGRLQRIGIVPVRGAWPRNFNLSPDGQFLLAANKDSNSVAVFEVDDQNGSLQYRQHSLKFVPQPICVMFEKN